MIFAIVLLIFLGIGYKLNIVATSTSSFSILLLIESIILFVSFYFVSRTKLSYLFRGLLIGITFYVLQTGFLFLVDLLGKDSCEGLLCGLLGQLSFYFVWPVVPISALFGLLYSKIKNRGTDKIN